MSRAIPGASLRGAALVLFVLTQLLTPLLHGHFGTPKQTGLHVHAGLPAETDSHFRTAAFSTGTAASAGLEDHAHADSSQASADAFEVDVESGIGPLALAALLQPGVLPALSILTLGLLAALASGSTRRSAFPPAPVPRWRYCFSHPPPAQAPPQFS
ncbi:hypothetical protein CupriaWKF_29630 [Cupriavidus sp. WKF15]|uniref:hypothetical protein n=1 Tax=Cupriavidus sp. WKF15 TaxID=3032282 RepID=UPI0023E338DB|nr:hypothetical protein [Cupriavidus sp. WKF15]WER48917.1 hypothetical protein CupriaWKF_29630 [Cupriavidus sp. WKF15]